MDIPNGVQQTNGFSFDSGCTELNQRIREWLKWDKVLVDINLNSRKCRSFFRLVLVSQIEPDDKKWNYIYVRKMWLDNTKKDSKRTIDIRYGRTSRCHASWLQCYERFGDHSNSSRPTSVYTEMFSESRWSREWYCSWLRWTVQQQTVSFT